MTCEEYLSNMKPGYIVDAGSEDHLVMHELSQRALKITMELNNKYHTPANMIAAGVPAKVIRKVKKDAGKGEILAIISNIGNKEYKIKMGDKVDSL